MSKENPGKPRSFLDDTDAIRARRDELFGRPWQEAMVAKAEPKAPVPICEHGRDMTRPCKECRRDPPDFEWGC